MDRLRKYPALRLVLGIAVLFWVICVALLLLRYYGFYPTYAAFDQGIFNQVFWNSLHGRWFESSLSATESIAVAQDGMLPDVAYHRLGQHFTPSLLLWLPLYALFPSVAGLSGLQVTLVTAAGLVLYALARCYHPPRLSAWISISFYAANAVIGPTLANFHDFCQIPLFLFGLLLAFEKRWWWALWLLAGLTLLVREDAGVILFSIGAYLVISRRAIALGLALCTVSVSYIVLLTNWVMPQFSPDLSRRFMIEEFGAFVEAEEASTLEVIGAMLMNPLQLVRELVTPVGQTVRYLLAQWLPLAFIPAVSPSAWVLVSFPLAKLLLQQNPSALAIDRRFAMTLVPGLFYGAILWWHAHGQWWSQRFARFWGICLLLALLFTVTGNPNRSLSFAFPDSFQPWVYTTPTRQWQHGQSIRRLLAQIPSDASVSASSFIVPHVSGRREVLRFPGVALRNDAGEEVQVMYAIADLWQFQLYQVAYPWEREQLQQSIRGINRLLRRRYGLIGFEDGVALLQQGVESDAGAIAAWEDWQSQYQPIQ